MPLSERDKRALLWGGAAIAILLLYLLLRSGGSGSGPQAEPVQADVPAPMPTAAPMPVAAVAPPVPVAPAVDMSQLRLYGILSRGAVIGLADGTQRFVPIGREIAPGVTLHRVEVHHIILATGSGEVRLGFDGVAQAPAAGAAAPAPAASAEAAQRNETLSYQLGLAPRTVGRRVTGYTIRPGVSLPALQRAGLQPGDLILRLNGSEFGEEQVQNLAWQIANSDHLDFEIERGGRPMRLTAPGR
jgi:type II secretion system protein C